MNLSRDQLNRLGPGTRRILWEIAWAAVGIGGFLLPLLGASALGISRWVGVAVAWAWILVYLCIRPDAE